MNEVDFNIERSTVVLSYLLNHPVHKLQHFMKFNVGIMLVDLNNEWSAVVLNNLLKHSRFKYNYA